MKSATHTEPKPETWKSADGNMNPTQNLEECLPAMQSKGEGDLFTTRLIAGGEDSRAAVYKGESQARARCGRTGSEVLRYNRGLAEDPDKP